VSAVVVISPARVEARLDGVVGEPGAVTRRWEDQYLHLDPAKVVEACAGPATGVVCLGPDLPTSTALALAEAFDRDRPELAVVLLAQPSADLWQAAVRAGVRDVVDPWSPDDGVGRALRAAKEVADRRRATMTQAHERAAAATSRVVTMLSPKGGSGKTTVTTNLAVGLAGAGAGAVAVVDLDLQFGDVASALQLTPEQTLADVARAPSDFDATMLKVFLSAHASGLFVLCAPESPVDADDISAGHTAAALELLRSEFAFVVVDTAAGIDEHSLAAVEASTDLVLVGAMDVASVRALRKQLDVLERLGMTHQQRHLVLNRADAKVGMDAGDIERVLGMSVDVAVPSSRLVPLGANEGRPVLSEPPRAPVARALQELVERFAQPDPAVAARRRWWGVR
jgi:pilus assembly protein CpaE